MGKDRIPQPGQIYNHFKNKLYQIITLGYDAETGEAMVVYQALYGEFKTYVRSLESFLGEVDHIKYPEVTQKYRFELKNLKDGGIAEAAGTKKEASNPVQDTGGEREEQKAVQQEASSEIGQAVELQETVNSVLLQFLDAESFYKKLEVITSNRKHMNDRIINDMAVSLDCTVEEGPIEDRIQGLIYCLQAMCRFEDKRLR